MEKFPKEGEYQLKYGFIFSSQSEEKEENKVSAEQKKEEKDLGIENKKSFDKGGQKKTSREERFGVFEEVRKK